MNAPGKTVKTVLMDEKDLDRALTRIAHEIAERNKGAEKLAFIGIKQRGDILAARIARKLAEFEKPSIPVPVGALDITLYRDDQATRPGKLASPTEIPFNLDGLSVVLVDDVLYTGRSVRAAMMALADYGRPERVLLAALIDRGLRELPIRADFVGKNVPSSTRETIQVKLRETEGEERVVILQ